MHETSPPQRPHDHSVERLPVIVFRMDRELRLLYVNEAVATILGPRPEDLIGRTAREAGVDTDQWAAFEAACRKVFATGQPQEADFVTKGTKMSQRMGEGTRYFEAHLFPGKGRARPGHLDHRDHDRPHRPQEGRRAALRESEERYHALISNVKKLAIFGVDLQGVATSLEQGNTERLLGYSRTEFIGLTTEKLFSAEDIAKGAHRRDAVPDRRRRAAARRATSELFQARRMERPSSPALHLSARSRHERTCHRLQRRPQRPYRGGNSRAAGAGGAAGAERTVRQEAEQATG